MGLRHRTALSSLREQRRKAEGSATRGTPLAGPRPRPDSDSMDMPEIDDSERRERLLERLRTAAGRGPAETPAKDDYMALQDELSLISQRHSQGRPQGPLDIEMPADTSGMRATHRMLRIDCAPQEGVIRKLDAPLSRLDSYVKKIKIEEPRSLSLVDRLPARPETVEKDPSSIAAQLTQSQVSGNPEAQTLISRSLALTLLRDS